MIYLYEGTPGSGKSFHVTQRVYNLLKHTSVNIICNFPVDVERVFYTSLGYLKQQVTALTKYKFAKYDKAAIKPNFHYVDNSEMTVDFLIDFCERKHKFKTVLIDGKEELVCPEDQTLVIIDEAALLFNCRGWQDTTRQEWCNFFSQHRKYGFNIILVSQNERMLDRQIRYNIEVYVAHKNMKYFNWFAKFLSFLFGGSLFVCLYRWQGCKEIYKREVCRYNKRVAGIYNSYRRFAKRDANTG